MAAHKIKNLQLDGFAGSHAFGSSEPLSGCRRTCRWAVFSARARGATPGLTRSCLRVLADLLRMLLTELGLSQLERPEPGTHVLLQLRKAPGAVVTGIDSHVLDQQMRIVAIRALPSPVNVPVQVP